jgi:hypothetical protein
MLETTDDTKAEVSTVVHDIDDESTRIIREKARDLSVGDEKVIDNTDDLLDVNDLTLSSMLFDAEVVEVHGLPGDTIVTVEFQKAIEFPEGDGWVSFTVRFEEPTKVIDALTVDAQLY